jgi:hypothetical protein
VLCGKCGTASQPGRRHRCHGSCCTPWFVFSDCCCHERRVLDPACRIDVDVCAWFNDEHPRYLPSPQRALIPLKHPQTPRDIIIVMHRTISSSLTQERTTPYRSPQPRCGNCHQSHLATMLPCPPFPHMLFLQISHYRPVPLMDRPCGRLYSITNRGTSPRRMRSQISSRSFIANSPIWRRNFLLIRANPRTRVA